MKTTVKYPLALASVFLWIGFVGAISFMEAWIKFRAPGITMSLGLGIGRLVFGALNIVEWVLAILVLVDLTMSKSGIFTSKNTWYFIPLIFLALQTIWLLPILDARAGVYIKTEGVGMPASYLHFYYVGMEIVKIVCLLIFGVKLLKS
ncbi:hypothetical protein K8352_08045 [Flavobacteriaceae bacterium F89]|uniref:DUF4149 domain-containing protein n=1 Tax=Cerina litoralis TaxID=2874477 RepID=A0AAE3JN89_9FLAO|nr:hypothetical protein [Cerina litoralis]MCG2460695.1 hypothetical protein [Cerina litoralis]